MQEIQNSNRTDIPFVSLFQWAWFFLSDKDQCGVTPLPSHMGIDDNNSLMSLTKANVGHACLVEQFIARSTETSLVIVRETPH